MHTTITIRVMWSASVADFNRTPHSLGYFRFINFVLCISVLCADYVSKKKKKLIKNKTIIKIYFFFFFFAHILKSHILSYWRTSLNLRTISL